jgi:hypothetical protein
LVDDRKNAGSIGRFLSLDPNDPLYVGTWTTMLNLGEGIVPLVQAAGGDFVCIDSRGGSPKVIYWHHERAGLADEMTELASSFDEFIRLLYEPDISAEEELD